MGYKNNQPPVVLTIAGSDSSGGAGIQADLKALTSLGVHGATVITCITAQNSIGVQAIEPLRPELIKAQLDSILTDLKPRVIKTGMLYSPEIVRLVVKLLNKYERSLSKREIDKIELVVDPVMTASTGSTLTNSNDNFNKFLYMVKTSLFPLATVITPNIPEAEHFLNFKIKDQNDMKTACKKLFEFGSEYVLLKGGHHVEGDESTPSQDVVDYLYNGKFQTFKANRIEKEVHGTGCTFASLIAGYLAKGDEVPKAVSNAKNNIYSSILNSIKIGSGIDVVNTSQNSRLRD